LAFNAAFKTFIIFPLVIHNLVLNSKNAPQLRKIQRITRVLPLLGLDDKVLCFIFSILN
jgi:hypothetical protein